MHKQYVLMAGMSTYFRLRKDGTYGNSNNHNPRIAPDRSESKESHIKSRDSGT